MNPIIKNILFSIRELFSKEKIKCLKCGEAIRGIEKLVFYSVVSAIFLVAFVMRFRSYSAPFSGPDTIGYLGVAFQYLDKGFFGSIAERTYPYPLFLTVIISIFKDASVITVIQHTLGLIAGFLFLRIWLSVDLMFLKLSGISKYFYWSVGVVGLYVLLCSDWSVNIEHFSHPESLTTFLIISLVAIYLKLYQSCIQKSPFALILFYGISSFLINYLIFKYQPRYGVNLIFVALAFCIILFKNLDKEKASLVIISSIIVTYTLLILPFSTFSDKGLSKLNRAGMFFFYNLKVIAPLIESDLESVEMDAKKKLLLENILADLEKAKDPNNNFSTGFSKSLGLNADYLIRTYYKVLEFHGHPVRAADFYISYLKRVVISHPFELMMKIIREILGFYSNDVMFTMMDDKQKIWDNSYNLMTLTFKSHFPNNEVLTKYTNSLNLIRKDQVHLEPFAPIFSNIFFIQVIAKKILPAISIIFLALLLLNLKWRNKYYKFGLFVLSLMILQLGFNVTISIANTNYVLRYLCDQLAVIMLFESFALVFIVLYICHLLRVLYQNIVDLFRSSYIRRSSGRSHQDQSLLF